mgnify:CR=1 FL=1
MPQIIICPDCARKLRVPEDLLGKKIRLSPATVIVTERGVSAP